MRKILKNEIGITLIALVITIIVLLILAGVSIATLTGENGILNQAETAKEETEIATEKEALQLTIINYNASNEAKYDIGEKLYSRTVANGDKWNIIMYNNIAYGTGWNYIGRGIELENYGETTKEWLANYETGEVVRLEEGKYDKIKYGENLAVTDGLVLNIDPINMSDNTSWGDGVTLHGKTENDESGWQGSEFRFDGVDDYIEVYTDVSMENGFTFEFYANYDNTKSTMALLSKDGGTYATMGMRSYISNGNGFGLSMGSAASESSWAVSASTANHWITKNIQQDFRNDEGGYLTITVDLNNNIIALYEKGEFLDQTTCSSTWLGQSKITDSTIPFIVGKYNAYEDDRAISDYSKMNLYACRLYNRILTAEEISENTDKTIYYHNLLVQE